MKHVSEYPRRGINDISIGSLSPKGRGLEPALKRSEGVRGIAKMILTLSPPLARFST